MINPRPAFADTQPVVLIKSSGRRFGFAEIEDAFVAAEAYDLIECGPGAHAVASAMTAKSNVTLNVRPGATVTFAAEIQIGAGITNFKIVGDGNLVFTGDIFKLTGIIGTGNEINVRGNISAGAIALRQETDANQVSAVEIHGRNISITGENFGDGYFGIMRLNEANEVELHITAENDLNIPAMRVNVAVGNNRLVLKADTINCSNDHFHTGSNIIVFARELNLGGATNFTDSDGNQCLYEFNVDAINMNSATGIYVNEATTTMTFKKFARIKNSSVANPAHVFSAPDGMTLTFHEGAILYTAGGANSKAASPSGSIYANAPVRSNKELDNTGPVNIVGSDFDLIAELSL